MNTKSSLRLFGAIASLGCLVTLSRSLILYATQVGFRGAEAGRVVVHSSVVHFTGIALTIFGGVGVLVMSILQKMEVDEPQSH